MVDRIGPFDDPDRYQVLELVSRGAEGELWRGSVAVDGQQLPVAVKIMHAVDAAAFDEIAQRVRDQAELLRSLEHPALVKVRDVFDGPEPHGAGSTALSGRSVYLVMNWASGESLPVWCARHPDRDVLEVTRIVTKIASAVDYLHSGNATGGVAVLHRDIKPANVIVDGPEVRLVDFGFARLAGDQMTIVGTPAYLAPEVVAGAPPSATSDRYSLGATAYYLFTGEDPDPNNVAAMKARLVRVHGFEGREDIADHLLAMMARDPARRPTNVVEWAQALAIGTVSERMPQTATDQDRAISPSGTRGGRRRRRALVVIGGVAGIALLGAGAAVALGGGGGSSSSAGAAPAAHERAVRISMPDVTGLTLADAKARLRRAGITDLAVEHEQSSDKAGTVIATDPPAGGRVHGTVTVTVADEAKTIPDVTGKSLIDATQALERLGVSVTSVDVFDDSKADGTVLEQDPAAGSALPTTVTLKVARQAVSTFIADLEPVAGSAPVGPANISGKPYAHSVRLDAGESRPDDVEYDLGRHYRRLRGTIGLRDDSSSTGQVKIEIFGDGRPLFAQVMAIGQAAPLDVDVSGVLRLRLAATYVDYQCCESSTAIFGDLSVLGSPNEVPAYDPSTSTTSIPYQP